MREPSNAKSQIIAELCHVTDTATSNDNDVLVPAVTKP